MDQHPGLGMGGFGGFKLVNHDFIMDVAIAVIENKMLFRNLLVQ